MNFYTFCPVNITLEDFVSRPYLQALTFILLSVLLLAVVRPKETDTVYTLTGVVYAIFILANCVMIFFVPRVWPYFFYSMLCSVLYVGLIAMLNELYERIASSSGSGESGMIFLVIMYHPIAGLLAIFIKWIYNVVFS